jgi:hypothetical protein
MKGRLDELALGCLQLGIKRGAINLGLTPEIGETAAADLTPVCRRLIAQHFPADPLTVESVLERAGILHATKDIKPK